MNRRAFLAATGAGVIGALGATLPLAHGDATLDADVTVTEPRWRPVDDEDHEYRLAGLVFQLHSRLDEPLEPVVFCWGRYNWMMQSWTIVDGPQPLPAGETATYRVEAPDDDSTWLYPGQTAQVSVVQKGTERRVQEQFVPTEVADVWS